MPAIHTILKTAAALLLAVTPLAATAEEIAWSLFEPGCADGLSTLEVACGDYGVFHFVNVQAPEGCVPLVGGQEEPPGYSNPGTLQSFPVDPHILLGSFEPAPQSVGGTSGRDLDPVGSAGAGLPGPTVTELALTTTNPVWPNTPSLPQLPGLPTLAPLLIFIDFDGPHGASTTFVGERLGRAASTAALTLLDDPSLDPLGEQVGDFHVLAKLCEVADGVDNGLFEAPQIVNMSFGRAVENNDIASPADCDQQKASCQIAAVIEHLRDEGTLLVAAAGNHREELFPAWLDEVMSIGMLDLDTFFDGGPTQPAWETPPDTHGLLPGNGLCLRFWPAPAGASYAAAVFTGWLSSVLEHKPNIDPMVLGSWAPRYHTDLGCYVLTAGTDVFPWCNPAVTKMFDGLLGANAEICWFAAETPDEEIGPPSVSSQPAELPSFDEWVATTSATPESDPCVPCVGLVGPGQSFVIDFSQTQPFPDEIYLDEVSLRVGSSFYTLLLSPGQLDAIEDGALAQLVLAGWAPLVQSGEPLSLRFHLTDEDGADCHGPAPVHCYWTSVPVLTK